MSTRSAWRDDAGAEGIEHLDMDSILANMDKIMSETELSAEPVRPATAQAMHACLRRHGLMHACLPHYTADPHSSTSVHSSMITPSPSISTGRPGRKQRSRTPLYNSMCLARSADPGSAAPSEMTLVTRCMHQCPLHCATDINLSSCAELSTAPHCHCAVLSTAPHCHCAVLTTAPHCHCAGTEH